MRKLFASYLLNEMLQDDKIWLLTGDLGFGLWDTIRHQFPYRFINAGAAEQAMLDIAVGLAISGQIPIVYSITPFLLYRPFETIRTYIDYEQIPVKLIGGGRNQDYEHDGISHWANDDLKIMSSLNNIELHKPDEAQLTQEWVHQLLHNNKPIYLNLRIK